MKPELIDLSDQAWTRLWSRLEGLSDEEYLWEPAPGPWTVHERDGRWVHDWIQPEPDPAPLTTLSWRIWHLIDMYGEDRAWKWLDLPPQGPAVGLDDPEGVPPSSAGEALALLAAAHDRWDAHLHLVTEESLGEKVGRVGGEYAERTRADYVLHMLDEYIHHGAEVGLLRDLWRWQNPLGVDALTEKAMRGDITLLDELDGVESEAASEIMRTAATYGRWELVVSLIRAGVEVPTSGRTPLHSAAVAGELEIVQLLVIHGADTTTLDPEFHAPPVEWARFLGHREVVDWFDSLATE